MSSSISISDPPARRGIGPRLALHLAAFLGAAILVWIVYAASAAVFLRESVALRSTKEMADAKLAPLNDPARKGHLIVVAGSNGLYSIDSPTLARLTGLPVVNASMQWSYTFIMLERIVRLAKPGDVLLLPLEYEYFTTIDEQPKLEACYRIMQDRGGVESAAAFLALIRRCSPYLMFDAFFAQSLSGLGVRYPGQPVSSVISPEGDILENAAGVNRWRQPTRVTLQAPEDFAASRLHALLRQAREQGATVLLTYPVRPEKSGSFPVLSRRWIDLYEAWAKSAGARVVSDPERHLFPLACFFDSPYHLHRGCTPQNSEIYARGIADALKAQPR